MALSSWELIATFATALLLGTTFAHVLEMPAKLRAAPDLWLTIQHTLYGRFASVGGALEVSSIVSAAVLVYLERRDPVSFTLAALAAGLVVVAFGAIWLGLTSPVNARTAGWTPSTMPPDWWHWRNLWEYSHAVRFVLHLLAFTALLMLLTRHN